MAQKYVFVITHSVRRTDGTEHTDTIGVADTLIGAEKYTERFIREHFSLDMLFEPTGWGTSATPWFTSTGRFADSHRYTVGPALKVNRNTKVRS
jgi:hypothetical protein